MPPTRPAPTPALHGAQRSLFIPLIARARAAQWWPWLDPQDACAQQVLTRSCEPCASYPMDLPTAINVLWRTCRIRGMAQAFFARHPEALGVNLGAGLTDYFQWLDNGRNRWLDVDMPDVVKLRQQWLPPLPPRRRLAAADLREPGWFRRLQLHRQQGPLMLVCEGVLMYMQATQVQAFFQELAEHAPTGSELVCDFISPWGIGQTIAANRHPHDAIAFTWGVHHTQDLARFHPRLQWLAEHSVAEAYGPYGHWLQWLCRPITGGPLYGLAHFRLSPRTGDPIPDNGGL